MNEDFLHYVWRTRQFDLTNLVTTDNQNITILDFGQYNNNAGADFQNARIRIGDMEWAGSVEMHLKASDWLAHKHQADKAYKNVILHVVYDADTIIRYDGNDAIPCLQLRGRIPDVLLEKYYALKSSSDWIPCQNHWHRVSEIKKNIWLERLKAERLERKSVEIADALARNKGDWEETFYQFTARNFGFKINALPMLWVAESLPHRVLAKHKNDLRAIEALLLGQAGFLETDFTDEYPAQLKKEYFFLKHKYQLKPIEAVAWKFSKLRPANFPTIRLAQFAALVHRSSHLFSKVLDTASLKDATALFDVKADQYWATHHILDTPSNDDNPKALGKSSVHLIILNTLIPFLFYYGQFKKLESFKDRALSWLDQLPPEKNAITEGWQKLGAPLNNAGNTQALLTLKQDYCDKKRCMHCAIGAAILSK